MSDDGTSFTIDLPITGQSQIDAAAASVDVLANRLDTASKASIATSQGISAAESSYRQAEATADRAAKALERVTMAADAQRGKLQEAMDAGDMAGADRAAEKLRNLMDRQSEAAAKAAATKAAVDDEAAALDRLRAAADTAAGSQGKVAEQAAPEPSPTEGGGGLDLNFEKMSRGLGKLGGPLGSVGAKVTGFAGGIDKLTSSLGGMDPATAAATGGLSVLAAAVVAVAAAVITGVVQIGQWAVGLADANRSALLLSQGIAKSVAGGAMLNDKLNSLTATLPLTREELSGMAQRLSTSGLSGQALTDALDKAAISAAKVKFGPDFERQMLSMDEQSKVFHAHIAAIFGGLKTDALMTALQKIVGLFDENSASGKALKVVFESVFQPLIDKVTAAEPMVERFFLQLEIWALKGMIALKPYGSTIERLGEGLMVVAAIVGGVLAAAVAIVVVGLAQFAAALAAIGLANEWVWGKLVQGAETVKAWLANFSLADVGKAMVDGLAAGITNGGAAILSAITGAVHGAVDAAKKALGIASPSKVFAEIGMQTGAGMAQGVDRGSDRVQSSLEDMVSAPSALGDGGTPAGKSAPALGGKSGVTIQGNTFQLYGVEGAEDAEARIGALLTRLIEGDATQLGAVVPG